MEVKKVTLSDEVHDVFQAAQSNDVMKLKTLLKTNKTLSNTENDDGLTPLGYAAHFGHKDAVQALLDYGANVNEISHSKIDFIPSNTALHAAIAGARNLQVIQLLLNHGADPNILDSNGHICLHTAAFHEDNRTIIEMLINHGAEVNLLDLEGKTALQLAEEKGHDEVAKLLKGYEVKGGPYD